MIYSAEVQHMCSVGKGAYHGPAPIPEEGKWVQAKQISDISGFTHGIGWCAPQQGCCKLTLNVKEGIIEEALVETLGCKAGIVLKPRTPAEVVIPYLEKCDLILVMTVEPGFGGQKFMADQMDKIKQLREWLDDVNPDCLIEVDGGVDANTCGICKENGADVLVAGSAYFKATDRAAFVKTIQA